MKGMSVRTTLVMEGTIVEEEEEFGSCQLYVKVSAERRRGNLCI